MSTITEVPAVTVPDNILAKLRECAVRAVEIQADAITFIPVVEGLKKLEPDALAVIDRMEAAISHFRTISTEGPYDLAEVVALAAEQIEWDSTDSERRWPSSLDDDDGGFSDHMALLRQHHEWQRLAAGEAAA